MTPAILLTSIQQASAASNRSLERAAKKACLAGDTAKGVDLLAELYVRTDDITWIFNQGRCFEQNRRYEDAIARFREYLVKGGEKLPATARAAALEHIEMCQSYLPKYEQGSSEPSQLSPAAPTVQEPEPPPTPAPTVEQAASTSSSRGRGLRVAGIATGAVGAASLATAVILNLKANSMADDLNQPAGYDRDRVSQRSNYETMSWVGYGVGSACLVGGAVLYYLGHRSGGAPAVALIPTVAPGQAGVNLHGAF